MNLYFRLILISILSRFKGKIGALDSSRSTFRCWPTDLDVLRHMNNGKYFSLMDLARVELMIRAGLLKKVSKKGWYPVIVAETARFRKSIQPFESFSIVTQVIGWDEKAILLKQSFYKGETLACEAVVRSRFLRKTGGSVSPQELMEMADIKGDSPQMEPWIESWNRSQS